MRKVTSTIRHAFINRRCATVGNTTTDGHNVWLHGNKILKRENGKVYATLAGWGTPTTRERLNGLTSHSWTQKDYAQYVDGSPVNEYLWYQVQI